MKTVVKQPKLLKKLTSLIRKLNFREFLHHFGPKKYKLVIVLKSFLSIMMPRINVPSYSALCKSRKKIPLSLSNSVLKLTHSESSSAAIDSTGISRLNPCFHYVKRIDREMPIKSYVKLSVFFDINQRKFIALRVRARPRHDTKDFDYLFNQDHSFKNFYGDSGYDSEKIYEACFNEGIQTFIKPKKNIHRGFYRKKQFRNYSEEEYHKRSLVEAGFSSLKRKYGSYTLTKNYNSARAELYLRAIAHNLSLSNLRFSTEPPLKQHL